MALRIGNWHIGGGNNSMSDHDQNTNEQLRESVKSKLNQLQGMMQDAQRYPERIQKRIAAKYSREYRAYQQAESKNNFDLMTDTDGDLARAISGFEREADVAHNSPNEYGQIASSYENSVQGITAETEEGLTKSKEDIAKEYWDKLDKTEQEKVKKYASDNEITWNDEDIHSSVIAVQEKLGFTEASTDGKKPDGFIGAVTLTSLPGDISTSGTTNSTSSSTSSTETTTESDEEESEGITASSLEKWRDQVVPGANFKGITSNENLPKLGEESVHAYIELEGPESKGADMWYVIGKDTGGSDMLYFIPKESGDTHSWQPAKLFQIVSGKIEFISPTDRSAPAPTMSSIDTAGREKLISGGKEDIVKANQKVGESERLIQSPYTTTANRLVDLNAAIVEIDKAKNHAQDAITKGKAAQTTPSNHEATDLLTKANLVDRKSNEVLQIAEATKKKLELYVSAQDKFDKAALLETDTAEKAKAAREAAEAASKEADIAKAAADGHKNDELNTNIDELSTKAKKLHEESLKKEELFKTITEAQGAYTDAKSKSIDDTTSADVAIAAAQDALTKAEKAKNEQTQAGGSSSPEAEKLITHTTKLKDFFQAYKEYIDKRPGIGKQALADFQKDHKDKKTSEILSQLSDLNIIVNKSGEHSSLGDSKAFTDLHSDLNLNTWEYALKYDTDSSAALKGEQESWSKNLGDGLTSNGDIYSNAGITTDDGKRVYNFFNVSVDGGAAGSYAVLNGTIYQAKTSTTVFTKSDKLEIGVSGKIEKKIITPPPAPVETQEQKTFREEQEKWIKPENLGNGITPGKVEINTTIGWKVGTTDITAFFGLTIDGKESWHTVVNNTIYDWDSGAKSWITSTKLEINNGTKVEKKNIAPTSMETKNSELKIEDNIIKKLDGSIFSGQVKDFPFSDVDGSKYTGKIVNGKLEDLTGKLEYDDGSKYTGEFKDNSFSGQGTYVNKYKKSFNGTWSEDTFTGEKDGIKYINTKIGELDLVGMEAIEKDGYISIDGKKIAHRGTGKLEPNLEAIDIEKITKYATENNWGTLDAGTYILDLGKAHMLANITVENKETFEFTAFPKKSDPISINVGGEKYRLSMTTDGHPLLEKAKEDGSFAKEEDYIAKEEDGRIILEKKETLNETLWPKWEENILKNHPQKDELRKALSGSIDGDHSKYACTIEGNTTSIDEFVVSGEGKVEIGGSEQDIKLTLDTDGSIKVEISGRPPYTFRKSS